jgi:hypothetical protein
MLKFHRDGEGYTATLPNGNLYHIRKVQRILLGRFGGGTVHTLWQAEFVEPDSQGRISSAMLGGKRTTILVSATKYDPTLFKCLTTDTKKLCVIAANAHANGANNMEKK